MHSKLVMALLSVCTTMASAQAPDTDIFLVSLARIDTLTDPTRYGKLTVTGVRNLTNRRGYDNQPSWSRDGRTLFFTSVREGEQADIYRMDPTTGESTRVTTTSPESEYSATLMPNGNAVSVIRVERDSTQRLWSVPLDGSPSTVILDRVKPVGYHAWMNDTLLALFVLGSPNTLQFASTKSGRADTIKTNIGRSLLGRRGGLFHVHKVNADEWWLTWIDAERREQRWIWMPPRVEDFTFADPAWILVGEGSVLKAFNFRAGPREWQVVADLAPYGITGITRMSVSPNGDAVAVVAVPSGSGRGTDRPR